MLMVAAGYQYGWPTGLLSGWKTWLFFAALKPFSVKLSVDLCGSNPYVSNSRHAGQIQPGTSFYVGLWARSCKEYNFLIIQILQ